MADFDVLILGGGPAGAAAALALRSHAPSLSVAIVEASAYESPRIGEVLPALAKTLLEHLGVRRDFEKENHLSVYSTVSAWGQATARETPAIFSTGGAGWHLDRRSFDAFLSRQAAHKGACVLLNTSFQTFGKSACGSWRVTLSDKTEIKSRFIVDATGRRAVFARKNGAAIQTTDRLVSFSRFFSRGERSAPETLIESFEDGWWYTARTGARRVVACLTDADIGVRLGLSEKENWLDLFGRTHEIRKSVGDAATAEECLTRPANSARLVPVCETDWLAVGDAATAFDPLSSQGIAKALRSAVFASYAIADLLVKRDKTAVSRYRKFIETEYDVYRKLYKKYYSNEQRWRDSLFWQRRRGSDPQTNE